MTMLSKPTIDDIEAHGYKVLTKSEYEQMTKRLEDLERLHQTVKAWREGMVDRHHPGNSIAENLKWQREQTRLAYELRDKVDELEAMEK